MRSGVAAPDLGQLLHEILMAIEPASGWVDSAEITVTGTGLTPAFAGVFVEERPVHWLTTGKLIDKLHHVLLGFTQGNFALVYISDPQLKLRIQDALICGALSEWRCVEQAVLNTAFLYGNELRALWLSATHRSLDFRPDSKVMNGTNLREAVDPFGDASFMPSAARSPAAGVSLKRSGVWKGAKTNWSQYCAHADTLLSAMNAAVSGGALESWIHPSLARWCRDFTDVADAYDVCFADHETLDPGTELVKRLATLQDFDVTVSRPSSSPPLALHATPIQVRHLPSGMQCNARILPRIEGERVRFDVDIGAGASVPFKEFKGLIEANSELIRVYYSSGHVITAATLSAATLQDSTFDHFVNGNFSNVPFLVPYCVKNEKPPGKTMSAWLTAMSTTDLSLFTWVRRRGLGQLSLAVPAPGRAWLYCDDGSGEIADFLHVSMPPGGVPRITAIHVKGANSDSPNREVSVSAFEVVVGQAIKNLRFILAGRIQEKIAAAIAARGPDRVWDCPWPGAPSSAAQTALETALTSVTAHCDYEVIIVQPHVMRSYYDTVAHEPKARKLRTLLFGALTMARSANARFRVVIDGS